MLHAEIAAFVRERKLPAEVIGPMAALFGRLRHASMLSTLVEPVASVDLEPNTADAPTAPSIKARRPLSGATPVTSLLPSSSRIDWPRKRYS